MLSLVTFGAEALAVRLPEQTTVPVMFDHKIDAAKAKPGDTVTGRTMQVVLLGDGGELPKGSRAIGHVVSARGYQFDETPYAVQQASYVTIQIDRFEDKGESIPVRTSLRVIADAPTTQQALSPQSDADTDHVGTMVMVGGAQYSPIGKRVTSGQFQDVVGYNKKQGVFAHLIPASYEGNLHCDGSQTEQSMAIFSPDACGLYGFAGDSLSTDAATGSFRLESTHHSVVIYGGSSASLQVQ
jgi:hypothetical protein